MVAFEVILGALVALPFVVGALLYWLGAGAASVTLGVLGALGASLTVFLYSVDVSGNVLVCSLFGGTGSDQKVAECIEKKNAQAWESILKPAAASAAFLVLAILAGLQARRRR